MDAPTQRPAKRSRITIPAGLLAPLLTCLALALVARIGIAIGFPGVWRADEVFQYMEPASKLAFGHAILAWEWQAGIRSWMVPGFIAGVLRLAHDLGLPGGFTVIRSVLSLLSLPLVGLFVWAGWRMDGRRGAWVFGIAGALWPDIVNAGFRTLGEFMGGNSLACGVVLGGIALSRARKAGRYTPLLFVVAGLFLGFAAAIRFQFAPAVAFALLVMGWKAGPKALACMLCGLLPPVALLGVVDGLTLSYPFQSIFHNYYVNIHQNVAQKFFGRQVFFYYLYAYALRWGAPIIAVGLLAFYGAKRTRIEISTALFVVFYHSLIGHKEISFVYPAIPLLVFAASSGLCLILDRFPRYTRPCLVVEALTCILIFCSSFAPFLARSSSIVRVEQIASRQKDLCGLAFIDVPPFWFLTGGYSLLRPGIPIYRLTDPAQIDPADQRYSHIMANEYFHYLYPAARQIVCKRGVNLCLYRVRSSCAGVPDFEQVTRSLEENHAMFADPQ
ncbi:hypothetical protein K2X14_10350 [Acetobacter sp. TBRC 12305]|uniref:Mannosyltransferase n=1 Tax=Acetobacter garciniae TaxID=2817435 RepID=A0A939KQY6_9PROT|nr:hypothetical protein [Acetobacter garciniae]MBO1326022.1 hypothetical protein [Acetobacter garciniae]MBX0345234.1 hypothetical protein [Acetobacter garciniae]